MCKGTKREQRWSILLDVMKDLFIVSWQLNGAAQENGYGATLARILDIMSNKKINPQTLDLENPCIPPVERLTCPLMIMPKDSFNTLALLDIVLFI